MSMIVWILLGLVLGLIASKIVSTTGEGTVVDILLAGIGQSADNGGLCCTLRSALRPLQDHVRQPIEILRGIASFAFFKVRVRTPSSSFALICCRSILFDSVNDRAKCPTLYSV